MKNRFSNLSVHGRFQPVLHVNHWTYIKYAFDHADHVTIYITNPDRNEAVEETASWRSDPENNPFSYEQRKLMFDTFFVAKGILKDLYSIKPLNIKDANSVAAIDIDSPMVVNVYSEWSAKKVDVFKQAGISTVVIKQPKLDNISGTNIRKLLQQGGENLDQSLLEAGLVPEALPGLTHAGQQ